MSSDSHDLEQMYNLRYEAKCLTGNLFWLFMYDVNASPAKRAKAKKLYLPALRRALRIELAVQAGGGLVANVYADGLRKLIKREQDNDNTNTTTT